MWSDVPRPPEPNGPFAGIDARLAAAPTRLSVMSTIDRGLERLGSQLPLAERQRALPPGHAVIHRAILGSFARVGAPPDRSELAAMADTDPGVILERLAVDDLVVLDDGAVVGAYPFTLEPTAHRLVLEGTVEVNAMCSLDAVAVAPVFDRDVEIRSSCAVTGVPIRIHQRGSSMLDADPGGLRLGIRWLQPTGCAAHSMCREMVFLSDAETAASWRGPDPDGAGVYDLDEGIEFGERFFGPLLRG